MRDIPNEVLDKATRRLWFDHVSNDWAATAPEIYRMCEAAVSIVAPVIAEWAIEQAASEAQLYADQAWSVGEAHHGSVIADKIRALLGPERG